MEIFSTESVSTNNGSTDDKDTLELLQECPFFEPIVEDEFYVLNSCSRYADARTRVKDETLQFSGIAQFFLNSFAIKDLEKFSRKCNSTRFQEDDAKDPVAQI